MFVQVMQGKVKSAKDWERLFDSWNQKVRPGAKGFLGATTGVTSNNELFAVARFESEAAARENSSLPAQTAWYEEASKSFDGPVTFRDCTEVDEMFGGGSDSAGFVQVIQGRAKDQKEMRREAPAMESDLRRMRPDVIGGIFAWHGHGGEFTQIAYFTSEADARKNESGMADDPSFKRFSDLLDGPLTFFDLTNPKFA